MPGTVSLSTPPSLPPLLLRGALLSPLKHPRPDAQVPLTRLVLPGVRVREKDLSAYERVCGYPTDRSPGQDELPVTYPHILGFPLAMRLMAARAFPLPLLGLVHTSIEISRHRPLLPTDDLELTSYAEPLRPHRRGTEATLVTEVRTGGTLTWESRSTYLARHKTTGPAQEPVKEEETPVKEEAPAAEALPARAEWRLAGDLGRRYAAASGDHNPIHLHPLTARLFGFPRAIAHGMWTVARCLAEYGTTGPGPVHVRAEFKAPVLLPATVTYASEGPAFELRGAEPDKNGKARVHVRGEVLPLDGRRPGGGR
ncbi:MaoC family dehydratase [Streptomyces sp. NPDC059009]|uniref:MaoC family dehydratase n=1 Tax=Streptomyces sp. NPDC059009 TaxID=3346694 RepID=UPI0036A882F3